MDLDGSILVADTHGLMRSGIVHIFRTHFLFDHIAEAGDHAELLGRLNASSDIALLAVDLALLGPDHVAAVRDLRLHRPAMKLLVLTSNVDRAAMFELLSAGIHGYLPKDLEPPELLIALGTVAAGQIFIPAQTSNANIIEQQHQCPAVESSALTGRQHEVLRLLALGQSNKQIARALNIAEGTVKVHVNGLFRALGVHNRVGAVTAAAHASQSSSALVTYARRATDRIHLLLVGGFGACFEVFSDVASVI